MRASTLLLAGCLAWFAAPATARDAPFERGVNLTGWFQAADARSIDFSRYDRDDFEQIRNLGADVVRLPINLHAMTGGAPDYEVDPLFLGYLDQVVDWTEALGLHLVIDNHSFDPAENTDPAVRDVLLAVWPQVAAHFRDRSERVYYEVLNEPHGIDDATWNAIQQDVVAAIRAVDPHHTIIVGPAGWNSYHNLDAMPEYEDDNLIFTFHFYDPFLFTHQGATWVEPSMAPLAGVPFPYRAEDMPPLPPSLEGSWLADAHGRYAEEGTVEKMRELLDIAVAFREERDVPLFLGELGVYIPNSDNEDRVAWYAALRALLDEHDIAWTAWDYHGGFGLFETGSGGQYEHDLNVPLLEALGFDVPPQTDFTAQPDTVGFPIYDDRAAKDVNLDGPGGRVDFRSPERPFQGSFAIEWTDPRQFEAVGFDFGPNRDLGFLAGAGYVLEMRARCDVPSTRASLRFLDTDEGPADRPWRMGILLTPQDLPCNNRWTRLRLPLAGLEDQGAWEDGAWYPGEGLFDWSAVDRLEVVSESTPGNGASLWLDAIRVTRLAPGEPVLDQAAGVNGLFYDPANSGHGFDINVVDAGLVAYYYGHTATGERLWLVSEVWTERLAFDTPMDLVFYELPEGSFGAPGPAGATPWGTITLTLDSCSSGQAEFDGADGQLSMDLVRLAGVPETFCSKF